MNIVRRDRADLLPEKRCSSCKGPTVIHNEELILRMIQFIEEQIINILSDT